MSIEPTGVFGEYYIPPMLSGITNQYEVEAKFEMAKRLTHDQLFDILSKIIQVEPSKYLINFNLELIRTNISKPGCLRRFFSCCCRKKIVPINFENQALEGAHALIHLGSQINKIGDPQLRDLYRKVAHLFGLMLKHHFTRETFLELPLIKVFKIKESTVVLCYSPKVPPEPSALDLAKVENPSDLLPGVVIKNNSEVQTSDLQDD